jgi:hypothetical protein
MRGDSEAQQRFAIARSGVTPGNIPDRRSWDVSKDLLSFHVPGGESGVGGWGWELGSGDRQSGKLCCFFPNPCQRSA